MIPVKIFERILKHGLGSTSFQTLYSGYGYFELEFPDEIGVVSYLDTASAWIGASDPVVSEKNLKSLLFAFKAAAQKVGKTSAIMPVSEAVAKSAMAQGFYGVQIGNEPWYSAAKDRNNPNARAVSKKGATVERFDPHQLSVNDRLELDDVTERWRASRKMADLAFLNRVEPWQIFHEKKYFRVMYQGNQVAYLAAVPIHARNAWYLVDLIRDPRAPTGTTELILQESIRLLNEDGAREITLGMSPFAEPTEEESKRHPLTYWAFKTIFNRVELFYGFKSLFQYKQKFSPERWEPQYFIALEKKVGVRTLFGVSRAIFPKGFIHTAVSTVIRNFGRFSLAGAYRVFLNDRIFPKSPPESLISFLMRAKTTIAVMALSTLYFFSSTDAHFKARELMVNRYSYSLQHFIFGDSPTRGFIDIIIASFLHWDWVHISSNMVLTLIFVGFFECIVGSRLTLLVFFLGIVFTNPLTSLLFSPYYFFSHAGFAKFIQEPDIGCSLGIFACIGALSFFVKRPVLLLAVMSLATLVYNIEVHSLLGYNHLVALALGYGVGKKYVLSS